MTEILFARLPERNANADVPGKYSDTHFRISQSGYDGSGHITWDEFVRAKYCAEVDKIFDDLGWRIETDRNCDNVAAFAVKGKSCLYLHPNDFSGVCENAEREALMKAFTATDTFQCRTVDVYGEVQDMTDEQLLERLEAQRDAIEADLLNAFTTKRRNLYIVDVGYFGVDGNIAKKYRVKRLAIAGKNSFNGEDRTGDGICASFVGDIFQSLINSGKIVTCETKKGGLGYRTAKEGEVAFA